MVVPTELEPMARALHTLQTAPGDTVAGTNTFIGKYEPVSSPYMSELPLTPFNWMLLGDPNLRPLMAIGYYKGIENPIIETREADFNTYGVSTRGKLVFGVCPVDGNSAVFSSGDAA